MDTPDIIALTGAGTALLGAIGVVIRVWIDRRNGVTNNAARRDELDLTALEKTVTASQQVNDTVLKLLQDQDTRNNVRFAAQDDKIAKQDAIIAAQETEIRTQRRTINWAVDTISVYARREEILGAHIMAGLGPPIPALPALPAPPQ